MLHQKANKNFSLQLSSVINTKRYVIMFINCYDSIAFDQFVTQCHVVGVGGGGDYQRGATDSKEGVIRERSLLERSLLERRVCQKKGLLERGDYQRGSLLGKGLIRERSLLEGKHIRESEGVRRYLKRGLLERRV